MSRNYFPPCTESTTKRAMEEGREKDCPAWGDLGKLLTGLSWALTILN